MLNVIAIGAIAGVVVLAAAVAGYLEGGKVVALESSVWTKIKAGWASLVAKIKGNPPPAQ